MLLWVIPKRDVIAATHLADIVQVEPAPISPGLKAFLG